jgi:hypothetical protein
MCRFLYRLKTISDKARSLFHRSLNSLSKEEVIQAKQLGFSDRQLAQFTQSSESQVRAYRKSLSIIPSVKQIDTLAAEYSAQTNYLYCT